MIQNKLLHRSALILIAIFLNSCGLADICDEDSDGDTVLNCEDECPFHADLKIIDRNEFKDLNCTCDDKDADGIIDCLDPCPEHADLEPTICGCDIQPDGEGVYLTCPDVEGSNEDRCPNDPMKTTPGVCGCGVSDRMIVWDDDNLTEGNPRSECPVAENLDLCPFDPNKNEPGQCGCGVPETDTDNDGTADCNDECPDDPAKKYPGTCGCGISDGDSDGDTIIDCQDSCMDDPDKTAPGICGCGTPDVDTDGDHVMDCLDKCPDDPKKQEFGVCGCGVEDNATNLKDTDNDGTVDCVDKCPLNPYKITPEPTTCEDWDSDDDGIEDPDDPCPYNPNIHAMNADGSAPDCNYVTDTEGNTVFQIWDAKDLTRLRDELDNKVIPIGKEGMACNGGPQLQCTGGSGEETSNLELVPGGNEITYYQGEHLKECFKDEILGININYTTRCASKLCGYTVRKTCCPMRTYTSEIKCLETEEMIPPDIDKLDSYKIELMHDINLSSELAVTNKLIGCTGDWTPIDLYKTTFEGHDHTIQFTTDYGDTRCAITRPVFENVIASVIKDLNIDIDFRGYNNSIVIGYGKDSIIENLHYKGSMLIESSLYGEDSKGELCLYDYSTDQPSCRHIFGTLMGYGTDITLKDISVQGSLVSANKDFELSGLIGSSNNIEIDGLTLQFDLISSYSFTSVSDKWYDWKYGSSVNLYPFGTFNLKNANLDINKVEMDSFCGISKSLALTNLDNVKININDIKTYQTSSMFCHKDLNFYIQDDLVEDEEYTFNSADLGQSLTINQLSQKVTNVDTPDFYGLILDKSNDNIQRVELKNMSLNFDNINTDDFSIIRIDNTDEASTIIEQTTIEASHINTLRLNTLSFSNSKAHNLSVALNHIDVKREVYGVSFSNSTSNNFIFSIDNFTTHEMDTMYGFLLSSFHDGTYENQFIYLSNLYFNWLIDSHFKHNIVFITSNTKLKNVVSFFNAFANYYKAAIEDDEPEYSHLEREYDPVLSPSTPVVPENNENVYWCKLDENFKIEISNNYSGANYDDVFIPFTPDQTDEVISKLGDKWTKKAVKYYNVEQDKEVEITIPWLKMD